MSAKMRSKSMPDIGASSSLSIIDPAEWIHMSVGGFCLIAFVIWWAILNAIEGDNIYNQNPFIPSLPVLSYLSFVIMFRIYRFFTEVTAKSGMLEDNLKKYFVVDRYQHLLAALHTTYLLFTAIIWIGYTTYYYPVFHRFSTFYLLMTFAAYVLTIWASQAIRAYRHNSMYPGK
jgi:hypothetical protein